jgi:hypothetical protein
MVKAKLDPHLRSEANVHAFVSLQIESKIWLSGTQNSSSSAIAVARRGKAGQKSHTGKPKHMDALINAS